MVPKAFKEVKQQVDIVGKGRGDHGDSSWKGFAVFSRRTCHYRLCQVIYAHPSLIYPFARTDERPFARTLARPPVPTGLFKASKVCFHSENRGVDRAIALCLLPENI